MMTKDFCRLCGERYGRPHRGEDHSLTALIDHGPGPHFDEFTGEPLSPWARLSRDATISLTRWQRFTIAADPYTYPVRRWFQDIPMRIAFALPPKIALWAFIRVYGADGDGPGEDYVTKYNYWIQKHGAL